MDERDLALRNLTYERFVELGRAPTPAEVGDETDVRAAWRRLHDAHALVLDAETGDIRMANPFSAIPTPYEVEADGRRWYANCAWDAFGICASLHVDGTVHTTCPGCGDALRVEVVGERPGDETLVFHCLVPAAHWWDDIVFT